MPIASGANAIHAYEIEVTRGTTPGSAGTTIRGTQFAINLTKNLLESEEIRTSGQVADQRHGFNQIGGSLGAQLSFGDHDELLESALRNDWETAPTISGSPDLAIAAATPTGFATITRSAGDFGSDGLTAGDGFVASGFATAGNNRFWVVATVGTTTLTVYDAGGLASTDGSASGPAMVVMDRLRLGNSMKTWSLERQLTDLTTPQYQVFTGVAINSMQFTISPESIVKLAAEVIGMAGGEFSASSAWGGAPSAVSSNQVFAAFEGEFLIDETAVTTVTSFDFTVNNNRSTAAVVGSKFTPDIFEGTANVTGNLTAFMDDGQVLYNAFVNETESRWMFEFGEPDGGTNKMWVWLPRLKVNGGELDPPQSGPIPQTATIAALEDATTDIETSIIIYRT